MSRVEQRLIKSERRAHVSGAEAKPPWATLDDRLIWAVGKDLLGRILSHRPICRWVWAPENCTVGPALGLVCLIDYWFSSLQQPRLFGLPD